MKYSVVVTEQEPVGNSILCEIQLVSDNLGTLIYSGQMYFVCDLDKNVKQYFNWMKSDGDFMHQINKLNYKL